jgi:hypothetical protein
MKRFALATLLLGAASPAFAQDAGGKLPPYAESIRCAGLAEAASRWEKDGTARARPCCPRHRDLLGHGGVGGGA